MERDPFCGTGIQGMLNTEAAAETQKNPPVGLAPH